MSQQQKQGVVLDQEQFCCSVCLGLLREPVTLPCGHSYCSVCIEGCWDQEQREGEKSCPQCRQTFNPRPCLKRNNVLAEVVEQLREVEGQEVPPSPSPAYAEPGDVACDFCTGTRLRKAVMSCLTCLVSFCEAHLQPHYKLPALGKHKLVKASVQLQEKMCTSHDKLLEIFCRTDQHCICYLCTMDEHKGHETVSCAAERNEKQKQLGESQKRVEVRVEEREKKLKELRLAVESLKSSIQLAVDASDRVFTEMVQGIERRRTEVKVLLRAQERTAVHQAEGVLEKLEEEIAELRRTDAELKQLSQTDDHIHFIQSFQSLTSPSTFPDLPCITVSSLRELSKMNDNVSGLKDKVEKMLNKTWPTITTKVSAVCLLAPLTTKTTEDFRQDAKTNNRLSLPNDRKVTRTDKTHPYKAACQHRRNKRGTKTSPAGEELPVNLGLEEK